MKLLVNKKELTLDEFLKRNPTLDNSDIETIKNLKVGEAHFIVIDFELDEWMEVKRID